VPKIIPDGQGLAAQVIFRVTYADRSLLSDQVDELRIIGVRTPNQLARKVVLDFLRGKLVYLHESDKHQRPEV
jgi:hypothetical protein